MPLSRRRAAAAQKLDLPARPAQKPSAPGRNPVRSLGRSLGRHDPPAGRCGRGRRGAPGRAQGAAQGKGGDATRLGGELQAPAGAAFERLDLADDGAEPGATQGLLHGPEDLGPAPGPATGPDQDQTPGIEAEGDQPRRVEVAPAAYPKHRALRPWRGAEKACEQGQAETGGGAIVPFRPAALDLVQATERQAAARQMGVERGQPERCGPPERRDPGGMRAAALQLADARTQGREILAAVFQAAVFRVMAFRAVAFRVRHGRATRREGRRGRCRGRYGGKHGVRVLVYLFLFCSNKCRSGSQAPLPSGFCVSV